MDFGLHYVEVKKEFIKKCDAPTIMHRYFVILKIIEIIDFGFENFDGPYFVIRDFEILCNILMAMLSLSLSWEPSTSTLYFMLAMCFNSFVK